MKGVIIIKTVIKIPKKENTGKILRVAAYCRVSTELEIQETSLALQIKTYTERINETPGWTLAGIYAEQESGLNDDRAEWKRMLKDCEDGKIDYIITKSVSRFGRNILTFITNIRELLSKGIIVKFDTENLDSSTPRMRELISDYAALAQAESQSKSEEVKLGIRLGMMNGRFKLNYTQFLGYTKDEKGKLVIVPEEAEIVRKIFSLYLEGYGCRKIKRYLEENNIKTVTGKSNWSTSTIDRMLSNEKYGGNVLMQKSFVEDFMTGKQEKNIGQLEQYYIENNHEPIIDIQTFELVQKKKESRTNV